MPKNVKNATVSIRGGEMDYIRFGSGSKILVMLPGLGDSLRSMKGLALPMAVLYRAYEKDYTVYVFSRVEPMPQSYTTRDMARDQAEAMEKLGIERADFIGVSMGGMISQHLAADYPEKVNKLVLVVTASRPNPILTESVEEWVDLARQGDHTAFMESNLRRIYSQEYYRKNKWMIPAVGMLTKPKSYERLFIQAQSCLDHNAFDRLGHIKAPTFVVGGEQDLTLGADASREIAAAIPHAVLHIYPQWGHGLYEEAADFNTLVLDFLRQ